MWRRWLTVWTGAVGILVGGCSSSPVLDNPLLIRPDPTIAVDNPIYVPLGPEAYGTVFEKTINIINGYFDISYANRRDGRISTYPRIAPGVEQFFKPGSPDCYQRVLATFQTIRHHADVVIQPVNGGFWVNVKVYKELEDLPRPTQATAGNATFRNDPTVERQFEVIEAAAPPSQWIPIGEDLLLEQVILQRIKQNM